MIFNLYKTLDAVNTSSGIQTMFVYVNDVTGGLFTRMLLLAFFLILGIASYLFQKRTTGSGDLPASFAIAGFVTSGLAIMMSFIDGMIHIFDIVVTFTVTISFVLWMFMTNSKET